MKGKRVLSLLLAATLLLSLAGCHDGPTDGSTPAPSQQPGGDEKVTYTVTVKTAGGMPMAGLDVYIYADDSLEDLKQFGETDENGTAQLKVNRGEGYVAVISGAPKGYDVKPCYPILGADTAITLESALLQGNIADVQLGLGDVMYDFTVTESGGEKVTLSDILKEKDMVLLNFWYTTCSWCLKEFPYMQQTYQEYEDRASIIALNPYEGNDVIKPFQEENKLTFTMAACPPSWANTFGITGYPTSIVVDRYGVICLITSGGLTSAAPFTNIFQHFTGDSYQQKLCPGGLEDISVAVKPNCSMPSNEEMGAALNQGQINVTYAPEEGKDAEFSWPFILGEKDGQTVAYASNKGIDSSFAILYATVELKAGQAIGFDYLSSCESGADLLYVLVDGDDIYQISGVSEEDGWERCYPWVAKEDGAYELALCYLKDSGGEAGDDTVYVRNFRVVDADQIDAPTYIPRQAAESEDGFSFTYADIVLNPKDGYYHVGGEDGPLLLADLLNPTQFNEEQTVYDLLLDGKIVVDGHDYHDDVLPFASYASNASLAGVCTVTKELAEYLKIVAQVAGFDGGPNEWLKICRYFEAYGTNGVQLVDPIAGLAPFSAYTATLGKNVATNYLYYDRTIIPRGLFTKFVPTESGVYRITSRTENNSSLEGWIFDRNQQEVMVYEMDERLYSDPDNVSMVLYMQAGVEYFIDICYWDLYETGYIYYDVEYVAPELDHFRLASPGYFTYDTNATGESMYYPIAGGIKPVLKNGKYYEDLGNGKTGSLLYADFSGITPIFNMPLAQIVENGGFDFTKTEDDEVILQYMAENGNDPKKTRDYLKELWGDDYNERAEQFQLNDVLNGKYHGEGADMTRQARAYISKMAEGPVERQGCVEVDEELAQLLQLLMDKYTFAGVDHSWTKLCYYYDRLGPQE